MPSRAGRALDEASPPAGRPRAQPLVRVAAWNEDAPAHFPRQHAHVAAGTGERPTCLRAIPNDSAGRADPPLRRPIELTVIPNQSGAGPTKPGRRPLTPGTAAGTAASA